YSSYAYATLGWQGILELLEGREDRGAHFQAVIGYHDGEQDRFFSGRIDGTISREARGEHGFGFDPVFVPEGHKRTFAEMSVAEKGELSHRARALAAFTDHLAKTA
ncbi:MAG: non-canonical purine NTP pyrophosphatase, partial [Candidatus Thermoplasmatota archaeon]|nr:non-canonical purine NTP pyrophosphatase [Candidatus Thermoplasmatota archaeon]